ncbi:DEAD/DEAH box helicase family protein [Halorubrum sp. CBA1229]|uniref:DEAD/DEAH box helicase family protein n=1 Tax=Halorubrum sp. CBA1229 TaxID=1853699 RepID=UPI000F3C9D3E|nr:DEAD/DEAH box helicase family protein [Halorubrum sp. CBA1229]QKY16857.1 DEAD/DEAH box helicase family protein [Halorubrum sp. CBA1229]
MSEDDLFTTLDIPRVIDTSDVDFVEAFYNPLLSRSVEYKRGVGYFTTNWLRSASRGIAELADNGGTAKWIMSPMLEKDDWDAIKRGEAAKKDEILRSELKDEIRDLQYDLEYQTRNAIAWMIADGLLEIRFAIPEQKLHGDFHDKFGIFRDPDGNKVAFHGSKNDSAHAFENYEAYSIDCDWLSERDAEGVSLQEKRFDEIWEGQKANLNVIPLPEGIEQDIADLRDRDHRPYENPEEGGDNITLRPYQREAVDSWFANQNRGLFRMATGTGKTFTALGAMDEFIEQTVKPMLVVIAVPYTHLANQWKEELEKFGYSNPKFLYGSANTEWKADLSRLLSDLALGLGSDQLVITTHTTLASEYFRDQIQRSGCETLLIADEVHGLGSSHRREALLDEYEYRIGLSATPERHYDEEGSEYLLDYFGDIVFEYSLGEAIPEFLTPYDYYPIIVELTEEEMEDYSSLSKRLAKAYASDDADEELVNRLAMKRANIIKSAENKYVSLRSVLKSIGEPDHLLVYTNSQQIDHVQDILNELGIRQHKFTYREDDTERQRLLNSFDEGDVDALVAMKCLDEGVDVPSTKQAILMSNTGNPMQFIQRRGRVLRKYPGKEKALIYDFIVVPTMNPTQQIADSEKNILRKELRRFEEFAENARNEHAARNEIEEIRMEYSIAGDDKEERDPN